VLVAPGVVLVMGVSERVGEREGVEDAPEVGDGVDAVFVGVGAGLEVGVGVGVVAVVGVGDGVEVGVVVGVGEGVVVGDGVVVEVGEGVVVGVGVSVGLSYCFDTEFVAKVALAAIGWVLVTTTITPIAENNTRVMESTPISSLLGVNEA
jgi:hypothetical protein